MRTQPWGWITCLDLTGCDPEKIRDADGIRAYVVALCDLIDMKRYRDCQIVHFGEGDKEGFSMFQLIETSCISGHFANEENGAYIDVFSCKEYDPAIVAAFTAEWFKASGVKMTVIDRGVPEPDNKEALDIA